MNNREYTVDESAALIPFKILLIAWIVMIVAGMLHVNVSYGESVIIMCLYTLASMIWGTKFTRTYG